MIEQQTSLMLSPYAELYDQLIPEDHFLRQINELVDFHFVTDMLLDTYCMNNGRNGVHPIRMFKYLMLKQFYSLSDEDVIQRAKTDLAFKFFLDIAPEDDVIDASSLSKFRKLRITEYMKKTGEEEKESETERVQYFLDQLIQKTVEIAVAHGLMEGTTLIVDSSHTTSRFRAQSADQYIKEKAKLVRKTVYQYDESMKEKFPQKPTGHDVNETRAYGEQLLETIEREEKLQHLPAVKEKVNFLREVLSDCEDADIRSNDPDARVGYKSQDHAFLGYKNHTSSAINRIITAAILTTGEKSDGRYLGGLVEKTKKAGVDVQKVIGDMAYSGTDNLKLAKKEGFQLISKLHPIITNTKKRNDGFIFNKDADMFQCPAGQLAYKKRKHHRSDRDNRNTQLSYYFDVEKCKKCPLREGCYKGTKSKTYSVTIKSTEHAEQEKFQETELFKTLAKDRYIIEAKYGEMKNRHGFGQATNSGLLGMEIQSAMTIFVVNLKRIITLLGEKKAKKEEISI
ncbi:IS1182 family transposase [Gracilibacillus massiliensis]|uniref:IS1182 family transposase n=1 Tax=Gracilibacillus massiliensis TaxID=1564956 RepID=UPI00071D53E5|nr:IS1182 family transposase [Gracilibacillus massiliensis]